MYIVGRLNRFYAYPKFVRWIYANDVYKVYLWCDRRSTCDASKSDIGRRRRQRQRCRHVSRGQHDACAAAAAWSRFMNARPATTDDHHHCAYRCAAVGALSSVDNNRKTASGAAAAVAVTTLAVALAAAAAERSDGGGCGCGRTPHPLRRYTRDCLGRAGCGRRTFRRAWPPELDGDDAAAAAA